MKRLIKNFLAFSTLFSLTVEPFPLNSTQITSNHRNFHNFNCFFTTNYHFGSLRGLYACDLSNRLYITDKNSIISSIVGSHSSQRNKLDVKAFRAESTRINYIPSNLHEIFPNLIAILMNNVKLMELSKADLRYFVELKYLDLFENEIEALEADLFRFNGKLEEIWLSNNKITFIDGTAFDGALRLKSLHLEGNRCVSDFVVDDRKRLGNFLEKIKKVCGSRENEDLCVEMPKKTINPQLIHGTEKIDPKKYKNDNELNKVEGKINELILNLRRIGNEAKMAAKRFFENENQKIFVRNQNL